MIDHQENRIWAEHHTAFSQWAIEAIQSIGTALSALQRIQYAAPWQAGRTDCPRASQETR